MRLTGGDVGWVAFTIDHLNRNVNSMISAAKKCWALSFSLSPKAINVIDGGCRSMIDLLKTHQNEIHSMLINYRFFSSNLVKV